MKIRLLFVFALVLSNVLHLDARKFSVSGSVETYTAYLWRGSKECGAHAAPCLSFSYGNFTLQSYGFISYDGYYKEIDWDISYKVGDFTFHLADYYARLSTYQTPENYFDFRKGSTNHIQEVILCYEPRKLPFAIRWFTFVNGDWLPQADGTLGRASFSSYLEPEIFYQFKENSRLSLFCGASVFKGNYTKYTKDFAVIHLELRYRHQFMLGKVNIPVQVSFVTNPYSGKTWLNAGAGIAF
ncbi:MAG: hypothetical protein IJB38_00280 [Bacteroidales bacterium]|nr:hypothetical protein [Bacteroidales bacterium]